MSRAVFAEMGPWDNGPFFTAVLEKVGARETDAELARSLGVRPQKISDWRRGTYRPSFEVLERIRERTGHDFREARKACRKFAPVEPLEPREGMSGKPTWLSEWLIRHPKKHHLIVHVCKVVDAGDDEAVSCLNVFLKLILLGLERKKADAANPRGAI